jgi:hypothetical protein
MSDPNPNLMELAGELLSGALDIAGTPEEAILLENAAAVF